MPARHDFLLRLLDTPGPSGFETAPARVWRDEAATFADDVLTDVSGNTIACINSSGSPRLMLAGHIDEIGLMIVHVDSDGFLFFQTIGGWDSQVLVAQRVLIQSKRGPVNGVIGKKAVHLIESDDRDKASKVREMWIDIGAKNQKDALKRVAIGDPVVLAARTVKLPNNRIASRSIDNRIGAYVVLEALRKLSRRKPKAAVFAVATTQEEIGWSGGGARTSANALDPDVAIAVDVTHATDHPGVDKTVHGDFKLGGGPVLSRGSAVNPVVFELLSAAAEAEKISHTVQAAPRDTGTDADAIYSARQGIATGLVSVPNRYMHSPNEMVDVGDLDKAAKLLAAFARRLKPTSSFIPV